MRRIYPFSPPNFGGATAIPPQLQLLLFPSTTLPPKKIADDGAPKARKPRARKERPPGWSNARWAADVERRQTETRGRAEREKNLAAKRAAAADEQARQASMAMGQPRVGQFPGTRPIQGTIGSPSTFSPASSAMFHDSYGTGVSRFTPSPPEYDCSHYEGISPALRRGPLSFSNPRNGLGGMPPPNDGVMHEMITSGTVASASSPGFFTQEEARATEAVASRGAAGDQNGEFGDGTQDVDEEKEEEQADVEEEDAPDPTGTAKGKKKRKKNSPPAEPQIKWTGKEEECLAEAWKTVSMNGITGANQNYETYWQRVKLAFDECKIVDPYFNKTVMVRGDKAMGTHWGIMQAACSKWHGIQEEIEACPVSGADFELKMRRAFDMYSDDTDGQTFMFLNAFARIENCDKWAEVRLNLAKNKDELYNPDAPAPAASAGRPELGQKKLKELKKAGHPAERLQASFDKCWADARAHAAGRDDKYDIRWKEMLANQDVRIALLKATSAAKKRNTDLAFLIGGNDGKMDEETRAWYDGHRQDILRPPPSSASSSTSTPAAATPAANDASPPDSAADKLQEGTADVPVIL